MITISGIEDASTHLSGNPVQLTATTSGIPAGATNYKILLKIVSADGVLIGSPLIAERTPLNNVAVFNISGYIDQAIDKDFTWPIPDLYQGKMHGYEYQAYDVQIVPGEQYVDENDNLVETFQATWGTLFIVKGRLPDYYLSELNESGSSWFSYFCTGGRWLTYLPKTMFAGPYQPVKLWWKPPVDGLFPYTFRVKGYYSDGSTETADVEFSTYRGVLYEFEAHIPGHGLTVITASKKLMYYEVSALGDPDVETRTYNIDWTHHDAVFYLFVDNRMGGVDCIMLTGAAKYTPSGDRSVSYKPYTAGSGVKQRSRYTTGSSRDRRWLINSGFKLPDELNALDILLDTEFAWLAIPPAGGSDDIAAYKLAPIRIVNTELALSNTFANSPESIEIELIEVS